MRSTLGPWLCALVLVGCGSDPEKGNPLADAGPASTSSASAALVEPPPATEAPPLSREGSVVAMFPSGDAIVVVDEDLKRLHLVALPLSTPPVVRDIALDAAPAAVVVSNKTAWITLRSGHLVAFERSGRLDLVEKGRAKVPADAWGLALDAKLGTAFVTSAWANKVTAVDTGALAKGEPKILFSVDVPREPRGVAVDDQGSVWVSHLTRGGLTRLSADGTTTNVPFPTSPLRAPSGKETEGALGYSLALDGKRLFAARHALGALGREAWFGAATVDVMALDGATPRAIAPVHQGNHTVYRSSLAKDVETPDTKANLPADSLQPFTQPRQVRFLAKRKTLLVVGEGDDRLVELDAEALDPTLAVIATHVLGSDVDPYLGIAQNCAAPSGFAVSADETKAYVLCRASFTLMEVSLDADPKTSVTGSVKLGDDPLGEEGNKGRRLFYNATDRITSGGLACAGCHPDGRDDGFTWHEATFDTPDGNVVNFVSSPEQIPDLAKTKGVARRTPMLVDRVKAAGPYGWLGESKTLPERMMAGFGLHRWGAIPRHAEENLMARAGFLVKFLRDGLVSPSKDLTDGPLEKRGKEIFDSPTAACSTCHRPETDFTDRISYALRPLPDRSAFDPEPKAKGFKTPSLRHVGNHGPYLHDGSVSTLEKLIKDNGDRMGKTNQLDDDGRAALVAYLKTL